MPNIDRKDNAEDPQTGIDLYNGKKKERFARPFATKRSIYLLN